MNILEALKKYIRANGGSSRANNISEAVKDLDSIPQGSGGGGMVVNVQVSDTGPITLSADKTIAEIKTACQSGQTVTAHMYSEIHGVDEWLILTYVNTSGLLWFGFPYPNGDDGTIRLLYAVSEDGTDVWGSDMFQ